MKRIKNIFFFASFFFIPFSFGMEFCSEIIFDKNKNDLIDKYKNIVLPLETTNPEEKDITQVYFELKKFLNQVETPAAKKELLDFPLKNEKRLFHYIAQISCQRDHIALKNFWNFLLENNAAINEQDQNGNTPLLHAFHICTDLNNKQHTLWNHETVKFLLFYGANPMIQNKSGLTPKKIINDLITDKTWLQDYTNKMIATELNNFCYHYEFK